MTYEKFASNMESKKELEITRGMIRKFAIQYALLLFPCAIALTTVIANIIGLIFCILFLILSLFLYVWSFDILVENTNYYFKISKLVHYWWLILILVVILCITINLFIL